MRASFVNLDDWEFGSELIEILPTDGDPIDLHNTADLISVDLTTERAITFHIRPTEQPITWLWGKFPPLALSFKGVSNLKISQIGEVCPGDEMLIHAWEYYEDGPDLPPVFEFSGGMFEISYRAASVRLDLMP
ncbi:hypothetical protein ACFV1N_37225 [Streptosporangium canum]|uniref:hypothetical protein n=1 Tax=Streptosporangium canum TaxID=324952 RepID=UPI003676DB3A